MRHVARFLAASMAASVLSISAPALAAPTVTTSGITASTVSTAEPLTAAQKRQLKKKRIAKKKRLAKKRARARANKIVRVASKYKGTPYRWGGTTPSGFDCSGYVKYVLNKAVKKSMPRIAGDQMKKGKSVSKGSKKKGDLIGFYSGSGYYHIGIYAGGGKIWHAPRPGKSVEKVTIWTSAYKVRRI